MMRRNWLQHRLYFVPVLVIVAGVMVWPWLSQLTAQAPSVITVSSSFEALEEADKVAADSGQLLENRAKAFASWMAKSTWKELSPHEQRRLYDHLGVDAIEFPKMSIRWRGTLTPAVTDNYQFVQMRQLVHDSVLKLWIDDQLVLDTSHAPTEMSADAQRYVSKSVALQAGRAVSLRAEFRCTAAKEQLEYSVGAPLAVLAWETASQGRQLIPSELLSPPSDANLGEGQHGLKAEFYAGSEWSSSELKATRIEPGIERSWSWGPVVPVYEQELRSLRDEFWSKFQHDAYWEVRPDAELAAFLDQAVWQMSHHFPLSQRQALVVKLRDNPRYLRAMSTYGLGKLMESIYMLPGREHLDLLRKWSLVRPQPRTGIGMVPGWGPGTYESANLEFYWLIGHFFRGPYWSDVQQLWETSLRRPDGECNLPIAYVTAFTSEAQQDRAPLLERLRHGTGDANLSGDQRLTWHLALAFAEGALVYGEPQPVRGLEHVQSGLEEATSPAYRFWALQEWVARLASLDEEREANRLLDEYQPEFQDADQRAAIAAWRQQATSLATEYQKLRELPTPSNRQRVISVLTSLRAEAQSRDDAVATDRLEELLRATEAASTSSL